MRRVKGAAVKKGKFLESYEEACETLSQRLDELAKDPDVDAVHDARTAMRRLEARVDVLPESIRRSPDMKELLKVQGKVMKRTAAVRDLDVTREKVSRHKGPARAALLARMDTERGALVKDMEEAVDSARTLRPPGATSKKVRRRKLQKRFERVVGRLAREMDALLPVVTADPSRLAELHRLRIDSKKLRYSLELALDEESPDIARLRAWQDALGAIHDWDVAISYVKEAGVPGSAGLVGDWVKQRDREFRDFVRSVPPA